MSGFTGSSEAKLVRDGTRSYAHRKDVFNNAANACCSFLEGLYVDGAETIKSVALG